MDLNFFMPSRPPCHCGPISTYSENIEKEIHDILETGYDAIYGCIAWFTNLSLMAAVKRNSSYSSFVVTKANYLHKNYQGRYNNVIRKEYAKFTKISNKGWFPKGMNTDACGFRCVGGVDIDNHRPEDLMHNKFVVLCDLVSWCDGCPIDPGKGTVCKRYGDTATCINVKVYAREVIEGSYNWTESAKENLESINHVRVPSFAKHRLLEFVYIYNASEHYECEKVGFK